MSDSRRLIIAIDGPAGSGKSTVARMLASRLGYAYIETGAMYRAVALLAMRSGASLEDGAALEALTCAAEMRFAATDAGTRLFVNGEDVTESVRTPEVTAAASVVSAVPGVRRALVERQRALGADGGIIMEGRDIGTQVFPGAQVKVFLDASPQVRGERRVAQAGGDIEETAAQLAERDRRDRERSASPLVQAPGALYLDSSRLSLNEVVETILALVARQLRP